MNPFENPMFLRFGWPLCLAWFVFVILLGHRKAAQLVDAGRVTADERSAFTRSALLGVSLYCLSITTIQWSAQVDPFCLVSFPPHRWYGYVVWGIQAVTFAALLRWLWTAQGADLLARIIPAFTKEPL